MRVKKMSALALVVAAAGLSLTACNNSDGSSASANTSASTATSSSTGGQETSGPSSSAPSYGTSTGPSKGSEVSAQTQAATAGSMCKTDNLAPSASATGVNNGSSKCWMHGFPGVQLVGPDGLGDTGPDAARTDASGSTISIGPGEETRFLLRYIPNTSGSGKSYTRLAVTPPDEKVAVIVNLNDLAITIAAPSGGHAPDVYVDPIGYHVGSGK
jgi:hypothetical protein